MIVVPPWGATPTLLPDSEVDVSRTRFVEIRRSEPRHLVECFDGDRIRCSTADELGFLHPGIERLYRELCKLSPRVDALFAGSIIEAIPYTEEEMAGQRIALVQLIDCYRFDNVDLRNEPFSVRRALLEELASGFTSTRVSLAPLLRARPSDKMQSQITLPEFSQIVAR